MKRVSVALEAGSVFTLIAQQNILNCCWPMLYIGASGVGGQAVVEEVCL